MDDKENIPLLSTSGNGGHESELKAALELIHTQLHSKGNIPDTLPGNAEEQALLRSILDTLKTTRTHLLELSEGKLDALITLKGPFGGGLKNLQSHLRHLTWKAQAIATGDFSQKVDFLHDFSIAFNSMVSDLDEAKKALVARSEEIRTANTSLLKSKEQYKSLIFQSPIAICIEQNGVIILANRAFMQMFHASCIDKSHTQSLITFIHPDNREQYLGKVSLIIGDEGDCNRFEEEVIIEDGIKRVAEFTVTDIIFDTEPSTLYFIQDITDRKDYENRIVSSLHEKDILLKEVYHRVKNNMQVIWSLLSMQSKMVDDPTIKGYFVECQNRVKSLALVHENLYNTDNLREMSYSNYLRQISAHLFRTYRVSNDEINLTIEAGNETIPLNKAVPCSLIVNELLSNSLKYAFQPGQSGAILIRFSRLVSPDQYRLEYRDSGPGIPQGLDPERAKSLGMQLIYGLTRQLHGTVFLENDSGVHIVITFPT